MGGGFGTFVAAKVRYPSANLRILEPGRRDALPATLPLTARARAAPATGGHRRSGQRPWRLTPQDGNRGYFPRFSTGWPLIIPGTCHGHGDSIYYRHVKLNGA